MTEIKAQQQLLARVYSINECLEKFNFFTEPEHGLQIGLFRYDNNKVIQNHVHHVFPHIAEKTCEMLFVLNGSMQADIFTEQKEFVKSVVVKANEFIILFGGGHGFKILEPNTAILEAKNGPYFGVEKDKEKF